MANREAYLQLQAFTPDDLARAEQMLGLPLLPEVDADYVAAIQQRPYDIRAHAASLALGGLERVRSQCGGEITEDPADQAAMQELRQSLDITTRHVAIANNISRWDADKHLGETARDRFQRTMLGKVFEATQLYMPESLSNEQKTGYIPNSLLIVSPTGSGKSALQGMLLNHAGIGLPYNEKGDRLRSLLVVASQQLMLQYQGVMGNDTFRRFLNRDVRLSSYWQEEKDTSGDIVLVTRQSLPVAIEEGVIDPKDYPIIVVDEAHHLLAPRMQSVLNELTEHSRVFGYTATPTRNVNRDLRKQFEEASAGSLRECVEQGILNRVRLFSFRAGGNRGTMEEIAVAFGAHEVQRGRKVVAYCQQGDDSAQARRIARAINRRLAPEGEPEKAVASAIGVFKHQKQNIAMMRAFRSGDLRFLSTVRMLREGWDDDVDTVLILGGGSSGINDEQAAGRAMRPGKKETVIVEILPERIPEGRPLTSIFTIFGVEHIRQGMLITERDDLDSEEQPADDSSIAEDGALEVTPNEMPADAEITLDQQPEEQFSETSEKDSSAQDCPPTITSLGKMVIEKASETDDTAAKPIIHDYIPESLLTSLIPEQSVRQATIAPADLIRMGEPPKGHEALQALADEFDVPYTILRAILDEQAFGYIAVRPATPEDEFERWYGPDAKNYLRENPPIKRAGSLKFTATKLAKLVDIDPTTIKRFLNKLESPEHEILRGSRNRRLKHYGYDIALKVLAEYGEIPYAEGTDVAVWDLGQELGESFVRSYIKNKKNNITAIPKHSHPDRGIKGITPHITEAEAQQIEVARGKIRIATTAHMNYAEIAAVAGVRVETVLNNITPAEQPHIVPMRIKRNAKDGDFLPAAIGMKMAERLKPVKLPLWRVTFPMMMKRSTTGKEAARTALRRAGYPEPVEKLNLGRGSSNISVYPWPALQALEAAYPPKPGEPVINFRQLCADPEAMDPEAMLHAYQILHRYIPEDKLDAEPIADLLTKASSAISPSVAPTEGQTDLPPWIAVDTGRSLLNCSNPAFMVLFMQTRPDRNAVRRDAEGAACISEQNLRHMQLVARRVQAPVEGWSSADSIDSKLRVTRNLELAQVLKRLSIPGSAQRLGMSSTSGYIDVYYSPSHTSLILRTAERLHGMSPRTR